MAIHSGIVENIGHTAGTVWQLLDDFGPMSLSEIIKKVDAPRDLVMQSIGWLAREDKLTLSEQGRRKTASLRS
ncbi:MAG: winged helix-turn-helix domain-containing protein [Pirellulales bacterium]|nr:winged helix-turn-helix domain-containing protein [Pirellulales bacterium]